MAEAAAVPSTGATMVPGPNAPQTTPQTTAKSPAKTTTQVKGATKSATNEVPKEAPKEPPQPEKRAYKIKVLDREEDIQVTDDEIKTYIQKGKAADYKFEEAARARKEAQAKLEEADRRFERLKKETDKVLKEMGIDPRQFSEQYLAKEIEMEMLDPKERELRETKARLAQIEEENKAKEQERINREESEKTQKRVQALKDKFAAQINGVLKDSPLPPTERTVAKIATYMQYCKKNDIPFDLSEIRERVVQDYKDDFAHMFSKSEPSQVAAILGEDVIKKIRLWDNERVKNGNGSKPPVQTKPQSRFEPKKKYKTIEEDNMERFGSIYALPDSD